MDDHSEFEAIAPFMKLVEEQLKDLVDGSKYFDMLDDDVVIEFKFPPPGTPTSLSGKQAVIESWRGYGAVLKLDHMGEDTELYKTDRPGVVILAYSGHGTGVLSGNPYDQNYLSIVTIRDRKIVHWVDYIDPLVAIQAIGGSDSLKAAMFAD